MHKSIYLLFLIIIAACNNASVTNDSLFVSKKDSLNTVADSIYNLGRSYVKDSGYYESGIDLYKEALEIYTQINNADKIPEANKLIAYAYDYMSEYGKEKEYLKKALVGYTAIDEKEEMAIVMNYLAIVYTIMSEYDSAF